MLLKAYLSEHDLTITEFALLVKNTSQVVRTWVVGTRIPSPANMKLIYRVTRGAVDANSFYGQGLEQEPSPKKPVRRNTKEAAE
jgi:hypothetical protein